MAKVESMTLEAPIPAQSHSMKPVGGLRPSFSQEGSSSLSAKTTTSRRRTTS